MYYFLSLLTGVLISVMIAFNGGLTTRYGVYSATVFIHVTGLLLISAAILIKRDNPFTKRQPWFLYLGGAIGVLTTVFNNLSFGRISVSAILALGLFGQSVAGLVVDQYGFMGMSKHPFQKRKIFGLLLILGGIFSMINHFEMVAILLSFGSGVTIVVSRTLNAKLADSTGMRGSTFFNYVVGLLVTLPVYFLLGRQEVGFVNLSPNLLIYLGGFVGVCVVFLSNVTVMKVSAFYLSLLLFVGQVFSGILIDWVLSQEFSPRNLMGGVLVGIGLWVNLWMDRKVGVGDA